MPTETELDDLFSKPLRSRRRRYAGHWMSLLRSALSRSEQTNMGSSVTTLQSTARLSAGDFDD